MHIIDELESLAEILHSYLPEDKVRQVVRAYYYADEAHDGQIRRSGEPYITHPLAVATILAEMHMDHQSLMAAMLHDVIEDTGISKEAIAGQFGDDVAELVDGVTKLAHISFESRAEQQAENFQKMAMAMAHDIRVILVKLADRLHNMRTLGVLKPEKSRRIAKETLEIYAPIALRLGMNEIRVELEELGFNALYPMRRRRLEAARVFARKNRTALVEKIEQAIDHQLKEEGIEAKVIGREKHLYSIYNKMREQHKSFNDIMDVFAFRIVTDSVADCYRALGVVHLLYKPVPNAFKDYIAIPKSNGYQSLHTVLVGMHGVPIEVQIRTADMDAMASNGIAAHWLYKSGEEGKATASQSRAHRWVKSLLEMQQTAGDSMEFIENVKIDLFPDEVYVFTPKGKIIELPVGSTPVDFAYAVHTDVGNKCVACRIDRRLAPLSEQLQSGQKISIITSEGAQPNPNWLNFIVTGKARASIKHFLKHQRHHDSIQLGERLLNKSLATFGTSLLNVSKEEIEHLLEELKINNFDTLLEEIGQGKRIPHAVAKVLCPEEDESEGNIYSPLVIDSSEGMMISFAKCCRPIPGDHVVGHISTGRGLIVHREECRHVTEIRKQKERCMTLNWSPEVTGEYLVDVRVHVENDRGVIATLATRVAEEGGSIEKLSIDEKDARNSVVNLCLGVNTRIHLADIMRRLRVLKPVIKIYRAKN